MTDEVKAVPEEESKDTEPAKTEAVVDTKVETGKDVKIGEVVEAKPTKEVRMVPEGALIERKQEIKELKGEMKELRRLMEEGSSKKEISSEITSLAEEHNVDPDFLQKLVKLTESQTEAKLEERFESKLKPITEKERLNEIDKRFTLNFDKTLEQMPEYKDIADKSIIKTLTLDPANSNKTFGKILEEVYGKFITGKKTLEPTSARVEQIDIIDLKRAKVDSGYFDQIMKDPQLKAKYNEGLAQRIKL